MVKSGSEIRGTGLLGASNSSLRRLLVLSDACSVYCGSSTLTPLQTHWGRVWFTNIMY